MSPPDNEPRSCPEKMQTFSKIVSKPEDRWASSGKPSSLSFAYFFFLPSAAWHLVYFNFLSSHFLKYTFALPHQTLSLLLKAKPLLKTFLWTCKQLDLRTTWKSKWTGGFSGAGGWGEGSGKLLIKGHKFQLCRMSEFWILAVQLCRYSQQYCTPETNVILYINYTSIKLFLQ